MKKGTRDEVIGALRERLLKLCDDESSICKVAADRRIFCGGFAQWSFGELKRHYDWIVKNRPGLTRAELEDLANRWQLARQFVKSDELACDVQLCAQEEHRTCSGWDTFDDERLAAYYEQFMGEPIEILSEETPEES